MLKLAVISLITLFISACGIKNAADAGTSPYGNGVPSDPLASATMKGTPSTVLPGITYDVTVPNDQRALIEADFDTLNSLNITDSSDAEVLGINDFRTATLKRWLLDRTKYIVGESYNSKVLVRVAQSNYDYGSVGIADQVNEDDYDPNVRIVTLMSNLGAAKYLNGKDSSQLLSMGVNGGYISVTTPRIGLEQLAEGHFTANRVPGTELGSLTNRLLRLAVYFHEGRHTDGNSDNTAMPHKVCTSGTYYKKAACEGNSNGPYAVELALLKKFPNQCRGCTYSEISTINAKIADKQSRMINPRYSDPTPVRNL